MSPILGPDTKAIVRAAEGLTDQVRRIADALEKPSSDALSPLREHIATAVRSVLYQDLPGDMGEHVADAVLATILANTQQAINLPQDQTGCGPDCSEMHTETGRCEIARARKAFANNGITWED